MKALYSDQPWDGKKWLLKRMYKLNKNYSIDVILDFHVLAARGASTAFNTILYI